MAKYLTDRSSGKPEENYLPFTSILSRFCESIFWSTREGSVDSGIFRNAFFLGHMQAENKELRPPSPRGEPPI